MSIDTYYVLLSLSKTKSLTKTAEEFGLKVPSISKKIEKLENEFGQKFYYRKSKGIEFTPSGEEIIELCREVIGRIENLQNKLKGNCADKEKQRLTVSTTHGIFFSTLKNCINTFLEENPNVELNILSHDTERELFKYNSDIIIWPYLRNRIDLHQELIYTYEFSLYASHEYLKKNGRPIYNSNLSNHRIIKFTEFNTTPFAEESNELCSFSPHPLNVNTVYVNGGITMYSMVKAGVGIGPVWIKHPNIKHDALERLFPEFTTTTNIYIINQKDLPLHHIGRLFVNNVKSFFKTIEEIPKKWKK